MQHAETAGTVAGLPRVRARGLKASAEAPVGAVCMLHGGLCELEIELSARRRRSSLLILTKRPVGALQDFVSKKESTGGASQFNFPLNFKKDKKL